MNADNTTVDTTNQIDPALLDILVCPQTRSRLVYDRTAGELISAKARLAFPIREGVPIMLVDEARELTDEEILKYRQKNSAT
jgi:uncharacterized protein YbaR (Trm112 family)